MIDQKTVLAIIPARGGSKGVPKKNIRMAAGKPLIAWTIEEAKRSKYIDRLILSSDNDEIIQVAREYGCEIPFVRPAELARDDTPGMAPVLHALEVIPRYDYVVLLQPTSPLRVAEDIDGCLESCDRARANACVSVTEAEESPFLMYFIDEAHKMSPVLGSPNKYHRRQDMPPAYRVNGAVYTARTEWLLKSENFIGPGTIAYPMPRQRSLDIDNEWDLETFEAMKRAGGV